MHFITHCVLTEVARDNKDDNSSLGVTPHIKPGDNLDQLDSKVIDMIWIFYLRLFEGKKHFLIEF